MSGAIPVPTKATHQETAHRFRIQSYPQSFLSTFGCACQYLPMSKEEAHHLFQIIAKRYERGSIILTSNLNFSEWGGLFGSDKVVTAAVLDRLLHHSHVIPIQGDSYRLKEKQEEFYSDLFQERREK